MTDDIQIGGWEWELPIGIYPPYVLLVILYNYGSSNYYKRGPPPPNIIKLPPSIHIEGTLPPWPQFT